MPTVRRGRWAHHGVMIGGLPHPDRSGDAVLVSTTAATTASGFTPLSVRRACDLRPGAASFGGHLTMTVAGTDVRVCSSISS
ncbi:hypothetical protein [Rhodococcus phenolicus]|uniref:hypothetical protein n=1 Tax=Rhodococcus phenolicus TaxID=263849 RepID=UPI0012E71CEF|nr:hypothetical protein [Rhodococcus phenolicus]